MTPDKEVSRAVFILPRRSGDVKGKFEELIFMWWWRKNPIYKVIYWSTRKKGDIDEPYGTALRKGWRRAAETWTHLEAQKDVYRIETWERRTFMQRAPVVEEYHGNEAHLSLRNARKDQALGQSLSKKEGKANGDE